MTDFEKSLIFAGFMTALGEIEEEQKKLIEHTVFEQDDERLYSTAPESDYKLDVQRQRNAIIEMMEQFCVDTDEALGTESEENDYAEWYDIIFDSIGFNIISRLPISSEEKAEVFDEFQRLSGSEGIPDGKLFFVYPSEETNSLYCDADCRLLVTIAYASGYCKENRLIDFNNFMCELGEYIEYHLIKEFPNSGIIKNSIPKYICITIKEAAETAMDVMRKNMDIGNVEAYKGDVDDVIVHTILEDSEESEPKDMFDENEITEDMTPREILQYKLRKCFDGKIVRKDLTKKIKEGANVPVYVLEFLLGQYCSSDDPEIIAQGVTNVKRILADNFVRPDEAQKILSLLRQRGSHTVIDMITVNLDIRNDTYLAEFSNLGLKNIPISEDYPTKYDRLLCGGIWCIVQLDYEFIEEEKKASPIHIRKLTPIQMPHVDIDELKQGRKAFTKDEWIDVLLRSIGMEPDELQYREKWLLITRMLPLIENNFNLCELGPRSTGKSHIYKEISPNSILISGGQTTVANLFYNMARKTVGLVGLWDCVAFDEVAGINFKDKDGIQIMKDYMASGSFARGREEKAASASMVFVGNINQSVDVLLKTSSLFDPFPKEMGTDTAFLDRMHCYIPGWEIPKFRPEHFTNDYGFITDYLSEFIRELRKEQQGDAIDKYFKLGSNLNQRDTIAVRKMIDGYIKLLYPDGEYTKDEVEEILKISLEMRRRVKEQLKKLGGMEFYDVNFSYIDNETFEEKYVSVPEQGGGKLIPEGMCNPGQVYTVSRGHSGMIGVFRLESQMLPGNGKFDRTGLGSDRECREASNTAFNFLKANSNRISGAISTTTKDYIVNYQDLQGIGMTSKLALPTLIALSSIALNKPVLSSTAVLGEISISGTIIKIDNLADTLQVCLDGGAKKVLLPLTSAADLGSVPAELVGCFNLIFYQSAEDAVFKALGVE